MANNTKYIDQTWTTPDDVAGEQLSVNGYYTGEHIGAPTQDGKYPLGNDDPYYTEHNTVRYGTITQDGATNANMPTVGVGVSYVLTGCTASVPEGTGVAKSTKFDVTFTALEGYTLPSAVTVNVGGSNLVVSTDYTWTSSSGALSVNANKVTGDMIITVTATES